MFSQSCLFVWLFIYLCLSMFIYVFIYFMNMAYFALPPQSVPIRIVNPATASAAARVASPDGHAPHPAASPHPDRPDRPDRPATPKAVIGSVLPISPSMHQAQSCHRLVTAIVSQSTHPRVRSPRSDAPSFRSPCVRSCKFEGKGCEFFHPPVCHPPPPPSLPECHSQVPPLAR